MMSFLQACSLSPIRVVNSCGVLVKPQVSDVVKMKEAGVTAEFALQLKNNQDAYDLCMRGLDG